jgi:hypothetical protein
MACPPSSHETGASVMKNCELLVFGPVFAMLHVFFLNYFFNWELLVFGTSVYPLRNMRASD